MPKLSACVITRDEEHNLGPCLDSLVFCDEVVVVDAGSTDRTQAVARARGARVLVRPWPGMVAQKNRAVEAAVHDWVLCVDADERVSPELGASIQRALARAVGAGPSGYQLAWETVAFGGPIRSDRGRARWKLRLYDRRRGRWVGDEPHGHVDVDGAVGRLAGVLHHRPYRDLAHFVDKSNAYTTAAAKAMLHRRRSVLFGVLVRPPAAFVRSYLVRGGVGDGARGFVVAGLAAFYVFLKYVKLAARRSE